MLERQASCFHEDSIRWAQQVHTLESLTAWDGFEADRDRAPQKGPLLASETTFAP